MNINRPSMFKKLITFYKFLIITYYQKIFKKVRDAPVRHKKFNQSIKNIIGDTDKDIIKGSCFIYLKADKKPWIDTGIELEKGETITAFLYGRVYYSKFLNMWVEPGFNLWFRIGERGRVFRGTKNSITVTASERGNLYIGNYPGDWSDESGNYSVSPLYFRLLKGGTSVAIIRWNIEPLKGLVHLVDVGDYNNLITDEINRLTNSIQAPEGWHYLWSIGDSDIFNLHSYSGKKIMHCETHGNAGILQKDVSLPLTPDTEIQWQWNIESLPSEFPEDILPTHDYVSIAVEFDNGQDLTYYWSSGLPGETAYRCPIFAWNKKETHLVIRSGRNELGTWISEKRNIFNDYARAVGNPPAGIVSIWLIANSIFQRKKGLCQFSDIVLDTGEKSVKIL